MSAFNSHMQVKHLLPLTRNEPVNIVAMLLLRNKEQQQNKPLATSAICLWRQRSGHEWIASSSLYNTITVNLALT